MNTALVKLETENLYLVEGTKEVLGQALYGNQPLATYLQVTVPENWTEFGDFALQYALDKLYSGEAEKGWWTYLSIHKKDNKLIGGGGYKGRPNEHGEVEIGYEISKEYRNQGLATEFAIALINHAFYFPDVKAVIAHTLGEVSPSTQVLSKAGFKKVDVINDPEDGVLWRWRRGGKCT